MISEKEIVKELAKAKELQAIKEFTEAAFEKNNLSPQDKIKILELNQDQRLTMLKRIQKHTLDNLFLQKPDQFYTQKFHYDWWAFPMHVPLQWNWPKRNYDASITLSEAKELLQDESFVDTYVNCISLYIDALEKHGWNDYPVRYSRMLHSMALFIKAASERDGQEEVYVTLISLGERAFNYANANLLDKYSDNLFTGGYGAVITELEKFNTFGAQQAFNLGGLL